MIPSLDTYVFDKLESSLKAVLRNEEILNQALNSIDSRARNTFIGTYGGENAAREINVTYAFPNGKEGFDALYLIQLGESKPTTDSIGSAEGTFQDHSGTTHKEKTSIQHDTTTNRLYLETTTPIADLYGLEGIEFAESDNVLVKGNRVTFEYLGNEHLIGLDVVLVYTELLSDRKTVGVKKGFTMEETVIISPISTNMDTLRCLDALMKVILIVMRESIEEQTSMSLQKSVFEPIQNVDSVRADSPVYTRPLTLIYTLSYSLDFEFGKLLKQINVMKKIR